MHRWWKWCTEKLIGARERKWERQDILCRMVKDSISETAIFLGGRLLSAAPVAYGGSQARGLIRAAASGLCHSHSKAGSEPCLPPTPQLMAMPDPSSTEQGHWLNPCSSWMLVRFTNCWATMGTPEVSILLKSFFFSNIGHVLSCFLFSLTQKDTRLRATATILQPWGTS